jgi:hypothetical protein
VEITLPSPFSIMASKEEFYLTLKITGIVELFFLRS